MQSPSGWESCAKCHRAPLAVSTVCRQHARRKLASFGGSHRSSISTHQHLWLVPTVVLVDMLAIACKRLRLQRARSAASSTWSDGCLADEASGRTRARQLRRLRQLAEIVQVSDASVGSTGSPSGTCGGGRTSQTWQSKIRKTWKNPLC